MEIIAYKMCYEMCLLVLVCGYICCVFVRMMTSLEIILPDLVMYFCTLMLFFL